MVTRTSSRTLIRARVREQRVQDGLPRGLRVGFVSRGAAVAATGRFTFVSREAAPAQQHERARASLDAVRDVLLLALLPVALVGAQRLQARARQRVGR